MNRRQRLFLVIGVLVVALLLGLNLALYVGVRTPHADMTLPTEAKLPSVLATVQPTPLPVIAVGQNRTRISNPANPTAAADPVGAIETSLNDDARLAPPPKISQAVRDAVAKDGQVRVIISLRGADATTQASTLKGLNQTGFRLAQRFEEQAGMAGVVTAQSLSVLENDPSVYQVVIDEPIIPLGDAVLPAEVGAASGADTLPSVSVIHADEVHTRLHKTGKGVRVAVLDTGVYNMPPYLTQSDIGTELCFAAPVGCPNGSGFQMGQGAAAAPPGQKHGTNVAAIITAPNGVAPDAEIVAVRVFDQYGHGYTSDWINAIGYIVKNNDSLKVDVINLSLGTVRVYGPAAGSTTTACDQVDELAPAKAVIDDAVKNHITVFAASGNSGSVGFISSPACLSNIVAVGATYAKAYPRVPDAVGESKVRQRLTWKRQKCGVSNAVHRKANAAPNRD
jgi:hypothetical protein